MRHTIEHKLKSMEGLTVWAAGRAASMLWLQIGERRMVPALDGRSKFVGSFALHIECPWSWIQSGNVIADQDSSLEPLKNLLETSTVCRRTSVQENGSFEVIFNNDSKLVVSVEADADPSVDEYWRLFEPGTAAPHFVVGSRGVET